MKPPVDTPRRRLMAALVTAPAGLLAPAVSCPAEPRSRRLIVPFEAGGSMDALARLLAQTAGATGAAWPVINRAGASGNIGTAQAARAAPDGSTLLLTGTNHLSAPLVLPNAGYDPLGDFTPLIRLAVAPNLLMIHESLREAAGAGPAGLQLLVRQSLAFSSAGYGSTSLLAAERFRQATGATWQHVPYNGTAPALRALMSGEVQAMFVPLASVGIALQGGRVAVVALAHRSRLSRLPQVPTLRELGVADAEQSQWYGVLMPRGGTEADVDEAARALQFGATSPAFAAGLDRLGLEPALLGRTEFERFLRSEAGRLRQLLSSLPTDRPVN